MSETDNAESGRTAHLLRDNELDAVTGGMFNAFAKFGDIKGEVTDTATVGISFLSQFRKI